MKYKIVDLDDTYNLKNFKCENTSINNYLYHDSYYKHILKKIQAVNVIKHHVSLCKNKLHLLL